MFVQVLNPLGNLGLTVLVALIPVLFLLVLLAVFRVTAWLATLIGSILVILGLFGFLPLLGFWMIPLGLLILSVDIAIVRRWRRIWVVRIGAWLKARHPKIARSLGYTASDG